MRKSASLIVIILNIFFCQVFVAQAQNFGSLPLRLCWQLENENSQTAFIASDNNRIFYLAFTDGIVMALDKSGGHTLWKSEIGGEILSDFNLDSEKLYILSKELPEKSAKEKKDKNVFDERPLTVLKLHGISLQTGVTNWQQKLTIPFAEKVYLAADDRRLLVLTDTGKMFFLDKKNGGIEFEKELKAIPATPPLFLTDRLLYGTADKKIVEISSKTGNLMKEFKIDQLPSLVLGAESGRIVVGDVLGNVKSLDPVRGDLAWRVVTGGRIASVERVENGLLISSFDNYVYLFSERSGKRLWRKRLSGRSTGAPLQKNTVAVFSTLNGRDAVFIELRKGRTINKILVPDGDFLLGNPVAAGDLLLFPTYRGLAAFGSKTDCEMK